MTTAGFQVGERVKLRIAIGIVHAGTLGNVERAFRPIDAYDVQFNGHIGPTCIGFPTRQAGPNRIRSAYLWIRLG